MKYNYIGKCINSGYKSHYIIIVWWMGVPSKLSWFTVGNHEVAEITLQTAPQPSG